MDMSESLCLEEEVGGGDLHPHRRARATIDILHHTIVLVEGVHDSQALDLVKDLRSLVQGAVTVAILEGELDVTPIRLTTVWTLRVLVGKNGVLHLAGSGL